MSDPNANTEGRDQLSVSGPLDADELTKLRAYLHIEMTEEGGADPAIHGLYDYYETTKRLMDTVAKLKAALNEAADELDEAGENIAATVARIALDGR